MTDFKSKNTIDTVLTENGHAVVKHYLQDVGSTFGMTNDRHQWENGWEHFVQGGTVAKRLASFGFALSPWTTVDYTKAPSIGKFEGDRFDPRKWRTHTPNAASIEMRDDDAFWAARRVAAFSDEMIRAIVHTGEFSDPAAEKAIGDIMIKRRNKILRTYLPAVNPIVTPRLENNRLSFENAAVAADVAKAPEDIPRLLVPVRQRDRREPASLRDNQRDYDDRRAARPANRRGQFHPGRDLGGQQGA